MKQIFITITALSLLSLSFSSCGRNIRTARDATPGNPVERELDWKYGANDIRIQTTKITCQLMNRWFARTGYNIACGKPRIVITQVDNCTDTYISTAMIREIFEGAAASDGRFTITVGNISDERELDCELSKIQTSAKYNLAEAPREGNATAPHFLAKIRISKAINHTAYDDIEDYRMTVTLYNIETQEVIDQAYDVLRKRVKL